MSTSASLVKIINDTPLHNASVVSRGQKISASDILLNGNKISISGNFHDIAKQINRFKARTGVTAEIHITKGRERWLCCMNNWPMTKSSKMLFC